MKHKSMKATTLAAALALSLSATALAAVPTPGAGGGNPPTDDEIKANSDTTVSIMQTTQKNPNISYTVPLYVTLAVVSNDGVVKVPDNYKFTNTTPPDTPGDTNTVPKIAVTNMSFEKLKDTGFKTVATSDAVDTAPANADNIYLTIGGESMPALSAKGIASFVPKGSVFTENSKPKGLQGTIDLPITGKVASMARTDQATAAQFRVKYTVSMLGGNGQALGSVYAGDDWTAAGLPDWDTTKSTNPAN